LDAINSSATLPIKLVRDANLVWARRDLRSLPHLRSSIQRSGLQLPILLTEGMQVADGAMRLEAYDQLGERNIPVVITSDWDTVVAYYKQVNALDKDGWQTIPMDWEGLKYLYNGPFKDLFLEEGKKIRKSRRGQPRKTGIEGARGPRLARTAELWGMVPDHLLVIFEIQKKLAMLLAPATKEEDPVSAARRQTWGHALAERFQQCEENNGVGLSATLARVRLAMHGENPFARRENGNRPERGARTGGREVDATMMANVSMLLSQLATTAPYYSRVEASVTAADAAAAAADMRASITKINALIRVIKLHGNPNLEEEA
jgi:hypothetical protein